MKRPTPEAAWPDSWQTAYNYDLIEVFGDNTKLNGHARAYRQRMDRTLELIQSVTPPGASVLDIAAAQGNFSLRLAELGYRVTWNDLRAELAAYVMCKHEHGDVHLLPGDVFALPETEQYQTVLITEIIEHVAHPDAFLCQVARLVRPGGHIVMTTPNGAYFANRLPKFSECADPSLFEAHQFKPDGDGHIFLLHAEEVPPLASSAGLDILSIELFTTFLAAGRLRTQALLSLTSPDMLRRIERFCHGLPPFLAARVFTQMAVCFRKPELPS
jgi:2-polyprenyl-3-methyl-5-hydroxy-6-metoxy-1,4-benzoquinol methylase